MVLVYLKTCATYTRTNFRTFSSTQEIIPPPHKQSFLILVTPVPGHHCSAFCLHGFTSLGHFIEMESFNMWPVVSGIFHSASCFQGSSMLQPVPVLHSFYCQVIFHCTGGWTTFVYPCVSWWTFGLPPPFDYREPCCELLCSCFWAPVFNSLGLYLGMELLGPMVTLCLTFGASGRATFTDWRESPFWLCIPSISWLSLFCTVWRDFSVLSGAGCPSESYQQGSLWDWGSSAQPSRPLCQQKPKLDFLALSALLSSWPCFWVHNGLLHGHGQDVWVLWAKNNVFISLKVPCQIVHLGTGLLCDLGPVS